MGKRGNVVEVPYVDFTNGRRLKNGMVVNATNGPVVVNEDGQALGGQALGKVILSDSVAAGAIKSGLLILLSIS